MSSSADTRASSPAAQSETSAPAVGHPPSTSAKTVADAGSGSARPRTGSSRTGSRTGAGTSAGATTSAKSTAALALKRPGRSRSGSLRRPAQSLDAGPTSPFAKPVPALPSGETAAAVEGEDPEVAEADRQDRQELSEALQASQKFAKHLELTLFNMRTTLAGKTEREHHLEAELQGSHAQAVQLEGQVRSLEQQVRQIEKMHEAERVEWCQEREMMEDQMGELAETVKRLTVQSEGQQYALDEAKALAERQAQATLEEDKTSTTPSDNDEHAKGREGDTRSVQPGFTNLFSLQMAVQQKDRRIDVLETQLATFKHELNLVRSGQDEHDGLLETQLIMLKQDYARLLDDVEGYQTLLQERTLSGELFAQGGFMQSTGSGSGRFRSIRGRPAEQPPKSLNTGLGLDLASELSSADRQSIDLSEGECLENASRETLEQEVLKLQDTNKALTLYVNTIVVRLMNKGFEHVLAKDEKDVELPNEPGASMPLQPFREPASTGGSGGSFLEKTRSMLGRRTLSDVSSAAPYQPSTSSFSALGGLAGPAASLYGATSPPSGSTATTPGKHGLRQLASSAVADRKSQAEAKRLAEQFKPKPLSSDAVSMADAGRGEGMVAGGSGEEPLKTPVRGSWFNGWRRSDSAGRGAGVALPGGGNGTGSGAVSPVERLASPQSQTTAASSLNVKDDHVFAAPAVTHGEKEKSIQVDVPMLKMPKQAHLARPESAQ